MPVTKRIALTAAAALALLALAANAKVTAVSPAGFISEHTLDLPVNPARAYQALTQEIHLWWDASHSYSGQASNFTLDARPGGCFCEALPEGGVEHMRVAHAAPGKRLNLVGGLGPLQGMGASGTMSFALEAHADGTRLRYRYAVTGYAPGEGLAAMAEPVDRVQLGQLQRLQKYLTEVAGTP